MKSRGLFDAMADRLALLDAAAYSPEELVAFLEAKAAHPWRAPGGGQRGALSHDVIHSLDVTEALGRPPVSPPERVRLVVEGPKLAGAFGVDLDGVRLVATDAEYAVGARHEVELPAKDVLLVLTGRKPVRTAA